MRPTPTSHAPGWPLSSLWRSVPPTRSVRTGYHRSPPPGQNRTPPAAPGTLRPRAATLSAPLDDHLTPRLIRLGKELCPDDFSRAAMVVTPAVTQGIDDEQTPSGFRVAAGTAHLRGGASIVRDIDPDQVLSEASHIDANEATPGVFDDIGNQLGDDQTPLVD